MKKSLLALMLAIALVSLTACGSKVKEPEATATPVVTEAPTAEPTEAPTAEPTEAPTAVPTEAPTAEPTEAPTAEPTEAPTAEPTAEPVVEATAMPTAEAEADAQSARGRRGGADAFGRCAGLRLQWRGDGAEIRNSG